MDRKEFQRKRYFFHEKDSRFNTGIICQSAFVIGQVQIKKIWFGNSVFAIRHIGNRNVLLKCFPPPPMTKLFLMHTIVFLHFTHHIKMAWERCQNAQKQFIIKTYKELILYKPVGKSLFQGFSYDYVPSNKLSYFSTKTYVMCTHKNRPNERVLLSIKL